MTSTAFPSVQVIEAGDEAEVLALNNRHAAELSFLDEASLGQLLRSAFYARRIGQLDAFLIAFDERAPYASPNFLWFRERYARFIYIDRVVVDDRARGRGHARLLYEDLFVAARAAGQERVVCEVNAEPPNPASDAFHARLGFETVGEATIHGGRKTVRYFEHALADDR